MAESIVGRLPGPPSGTVRAIDPFSGDGRLIVWLLESLHHRPELSRLPWHIELWDQDGDAVAKAKPRVERALREAGIAGDVDARQADTFDEAPSQYGRFHLVVTNPPWDVLKPDRRELQSLSQDDAAEYVEAMRLQSSQLAERYKLSMPRTRFSGWGVNLARVGTEVALKLTAEAGVAGVVSPASFLADRASEQLRTWMLGSFNLGLIEYFPAEARLFVGVDQPVIAITAARGAHELDVVVRHYAGEGAPPSSWRYRPSQADLVATGYAMPVHLGGAASAHLESLSGHRRFIDLEGAEPDKLWAGRELDETGHKRYLTSTGTNMFVKGRMVSRYALAEEPSQFVGPEGPRMPSSVRFERLAWRDVSRPSQRRRLQATLIPAGWVSGNSLGVAHYRNGDSKRLKALLAVMNSAVFELQVRAYLATAHVSLSTVRLCRVPSFGDDEAGGLSQLVERRLSGDESVESELEQIVARWYGVEDRMDSILGSLGGPAKRHPAAA